MELDGACSNPRLLGRVLDPQGCVRLAASARCVPELELPLRGREVRFDLALEGLNLLAELEHQVVEPPLMLAKVVAGLPLLEGGAAVGARHVARAEHDVCLETIGPRRRLLECFSGACGRRLATYPGV